MNLYRCKLYRCGQMKNNSKILMFALFDQIKNKYRWIHIGVQKCTGALEIEHLHDVELDLYNHTGRVWQREREIRWGWRQMTKTHRVEKQGMLRSIVWGMSMCLSQGKILNDHSWRKHWVMGHEIWVLVPVILSPQWYIYGGKVAYRRPGWPDRRARSRPAWCDRRPPRRSRPRPPKNTAFTPDGKSTQTGVVGGSGKIIGRREVTLRNMFRHYFWKKSR